jgi:hypothetical protein
VIDLREMIAQAETQAVLFKHENESIKTTLLSSHIPIPTIAPVSKSISEQTDITTSPNIPQEQPLQSGFSISGSPQNSQWQSNTSSSGSLVSMTFDEMIDASCLQITPPTNFIPDNDVFMTSPEIFNLPANPYVLSPSDPTPAATFPGLNPELSKALPKLPDEATAPVSAAAFKDLSTIAINFILAFVPNQDLLFPILLGVQLPTDEFHRLEHPCRTHFHARDPTFDPKGSPSGHELMASTMLYSHAPPPVFSSFSSPPPPSTTPSKKVEWTAPSPELKQLYAMSQSLPKGDWEITPVQAWFLLMGRFGVNALVEDAGAAGKPEGLLARLKRGLAKLVNCFEFGAVIDEARFWEVVDAVGRGEEVSLTV